MNMNITRFFRESGLKLLAISDLNACEYSILFYLLNSSMSGLDSLIANESELASIIGHDAISVRKSIEKLTEMSILKAHYGDGTQSPKLQSVRLSINWDVSKWRLGRQGEGAPTSLSHHEAVIFPFRRAGRLQLHLLDGHRSDPTNIHKIGGSRSPSEIESWQRIYDSFARDREIDEHERRISEDVAKALAAAHPIDQILIVIRHFGTRIPTLSLLASNWDHYAELYEQEHQRLDLFDVRQKQSELDQKVRDAVSQVLEKRNELSLSEEEVHVLNLLSEHRHPRRQLFWAYQQRIRYPKLNSFFGDTLSLMLPITQTGQVIKKSTD